MILQDLFENENNTMSLWHGGRNLEFSYDEMLPHKKGQWEFGPGLYLTTHFDTAKKYAKGGGKIYLVTIRKGTEIGKVFAPLDAAISFVNRYVIKKFQANIINDLEDISQRRQDRAIPAVSLVNLCLHYDAISTSNTIKLRQFLINFGADYEIARYGGRDEKIVIVFNPKIIQSVKVVKSSDVNSSDHIREV